MVRGRQATPRESVVLGYALPEQARREKTVKVSVRVAKPFRDQTVGSNDNNIVIGSLSTRSLAGLPCVVLPEGLMYSQATVTFHNIEMKLCLCDQSTMKSCPWEAQEVRMKNLSLHF